MRVSISDSRVVKALPPQGFIRRFVQSKARETDAPLVFLLGGALSSLSAVAPADLQFQLGGNVHAATWFMFVGEAGGTRKTTCVNFVVDLITLAAPHLLGGQPSSKEECKEQLLAEPQQLIAYPELGDFFSSTSSGYLAGLRDVFTALWDARVVERNLVHRQESRANPRLSLLGGVAPSFLERHTKDEDWTNGFMSRWLPLYGVRDPKRTKALPAGRNDADTAWLVQRLKEILAMPVGVCAGMTPSAAKLYEEWYEAHQRRYENSPMAWIRGNVERAQNVVLKCAMLHSLDIGEAGRGLARWRFSEADIVFGITLAQFCLESVITIVEGLAGSQYGQHRRTVLAAIPFRGQPPRTLGQIYSHCNPKINPKDVDNVMRGLKAEELIEEVGAVGGLGDVRYVQTRAKGQSAVVPATPGEPNVTSTEMAEFSVLYAPVSAPARTRESSASASSTESPNVNAAISSDPSTASASLSIAGVTSVDAPSSTSADAGECTMDTDADWDDSDWGPAGSMDIPD